jgi:two-component SAPR family response regulator
VFGLGAPEVFRERRRLRTADWTYALPRELLYYLLLHGPRTKEQIGLDFWPEVSSDQLRGRFRTALYHVRRALGGTEWVQYENGRYAFNRDLSHWFDVEAFESKIDEAEGFLQNDPRHAASLFREALDLYRGDFLEGESPGRWASAHRDRLRRRHLQGLLHLADLRDTEGAHQLAADLFRGAIDQEELSSAAHLGLARSLARLGDRPGALRSLDAYEELLRSALGTDPTPKTAELRSRIERGEDV